MTFGSTDMQSGDLTERLAFQRPSTTAADATTVPWTAYRSFGGDLLIAPNTAIVIAGNIATLSIWACSITWQEEPA